MKAELIQEAVVWLEKMTEDEIQSFIRDQKQAHCPHTTLSVCFLWMQCDDCGAAIYDRL